MGPVNEASAAVGPGGASAEQREKDAEGTGGVLTEGEAARAVGAIELAEGEVQGAERGGVSSVWSGHGA